MKIMNTPAYATKYRYIVARICDGQAWFWGAYNDVDHASKAAAEIGGFVQAQNL